MGRTWTYQYDDAGNIVYKREYAYTTGELGTPVSVSYRQFTDPDWGDLMTVYNGTQITYDEIGNPLSDGRWTYQWQHGRQLAAMISSSGMWYYTYDADGMRTQRTNNITTYSYVYNGGLLSQMTTGADTLRFIYDASGLPMILEYNGQRYYYVTNVQGDVVAILNAVGASVVEYRYDAWGNIVSTMGSMASTLGYLNPLRYRSYVYDQETGLYYLQTRYYNPQWGRFINADGVISGIGNNILGNNQFAYCFNNPVNMTDSTGNWPQWFKNAVKFAAKTFTKPAVDTVEKVISSVDLTCSTGLNLGVNACAAIINGQIGVSVDTKGNVAIQASCDTGFSAGTSGAALTNYLTITNAPNIDKLLGEYRQEGGSACVPVEGVPIAVGGDVMVIPDTEEDTAYLGATRNVGFGSPGAEVHFEKGTTYPVPIIQFNVFDIAESMYIRIMEW